MPMGDWRHFGERLELAVHSQDCAALPEILFEAPRTRSDVFSFHGRLAQVVEGEILPRLMLAHRGETPTKLPVERRPKPDQVERFCTLLLSRTQEDMTPHVLALLDEDLSLESLLLDLLAPAARHLGTLWEEDACDFVDVTLAIGRLQAVMRDLCARLEDASVPSAGRSILLLPCPGETHVFGLSVVASFFRESGWDVTTAGHEPGVDLVALVGEEWFDVIGLTLSSEVLVPVMAEVVRHLRRASRNPAVRIIVGGAHFAREPDHVLLVGADAAAEDGRIAPRIAESLLELRARAC